MNEEKYCKSCFQKIKSNPCKELIEREQILCQDCMDKIESNFVRKTIDGIDILFLSNYDGLLKEWLMNFKEYGDIELAPCFLYPFLPYLRLFYSSYLFVPLPSLKRRNEERGFVHLEEMLKASHLPYVSLLEKRGEEEQKEKGTSDRRGSKDIFLREQSMDVTGKKLLLFDDVYTSGGTLKASYNAIKSLPYKKVKALILMATHHKKKIGILD